MIKIELEFATGAEARQALTELLGTTTVKAEDLKIRIGDEKPAENFEAPKMEVEKPAEENVTKKRRTRAEIEAEKAAGQQIVEEATGVSEIKSEPEENKVSAVTKEMLQEKAVNLIRNSKKEKVVEVLKSFGADSIAQADKNPLKVEDYTTVMDELNKIG